MTLEVEIISKEAIKPLSPTPQHLKTNKLSLIDQYASPIYMSLVLFYSASRDHDCKIQPERLKASLSKTLSDFYPLAGRMRDNQFVECSDEGINLFETRVLTLLSEVLSAPDDLQQLLPIEKNGFLSVQLNIFDCGGMALGVCMSHKVVDASSIGVFLNHWAAVTRDDKDIVTPVFDMTSFFPPQEVPPSLPPLIMESKKVVSKRFIFPAANIAALKAKCSNSLGVQQPTRVEAVSALVLRCALNARKKNVDFVVQFAVNLRGRMVPPLSNHHVGNLIICTVVASGTERRPELQSLVSQLHAVKAKIDEAYVRKLIYNDDGTAETYDSLNDITEKGVGGEVNQYVVSSWCRFPFYDIEFGFGKPVWVTSVDPYFANLMILLDTKCGNGVEARVTLTEEDMVGFECDPDLIAYTSAN